ncbi:monovalent cation/H(+) antiporter subunit G [Wolbachia endosymbiont of Howardula sp.]|uniref:monovalent cation/H(+) antiporter subunit G n=1 Tax=Wolbachia endosymbiont of Howardula sp. TaxID=2916816 RepID=UPI00217D52B8|nr:monovalent cation/H(+) antiporter subunit G [Wolbachia endosymbiont of Howardula sp.]UWI83005.1 monovalent cation/H(+) antiporter subunit G [Wolbachia endosymbiont of Howardula sp.]
MIGKICIILGICFIGIANIGIIRCSDHLYSKLHISCITDASGATLMLIGFIMQDKLAFNTFKILLLVIMIWISSATNSYILAHIYYQDHKNCSKETDKCLKS